MVLGSGAGEVEQLGVKLEPHDLGRVQQAAKHDARPAGATAEIKQSPARELCRRNKGKEIGTQVGLDACGVFVARNALAQPAKSERKEPLDERNWVRRLARPPRHVDA